jgi:hypothetical protein
VSEGDCCHALWTENLLLSSDIFYSPESVRILLKINCKAYDAV